MKQFIFTLATFLVAFCLNAKAQDSLQRIALTNDMVNYYAQAAKLLEAMPKHDVKDIYIGTSFGTTSMPTDVVKSWAIYKTCDCTGKVIRIDSLDDKPYWQSKDKMLNTLDVEWQPSNHFSIRLSSFRNSHTLDSGSLVYSENNRRTSLREPLTINHKAMQLSAKFFLGQGTPTLYYLGGGTTISYQTTQKALTNDLNPKKNEAPPQYANVSINDKVQHKALLKPLFLIGLTTQTSFNWRINAEFGIQDKHRFMLLQTMIPLTPNTWRGDRKRYKTFRNYKTVFEKAEGIDRYLNPDKFKSSDSGGDGGGGDSGGSSGGGGGGCSGGNS